jgi:hypothetical protein
MQEGGKIMPKGKGTKVFVTMMLLALALTLILPTVASAEPYYQSYDPWRGDDAAAGIVYGKAVTSDSVPYNMMRVTVRLYERIGWWWYECASAVNERNGNVYECDVTAMVAEVYNEFKVKSLHDWETTDGVSDHLHTASPQKWC